MDQTFRDIACGLVAISRSFYARGWALGTSGNFSAVLSAWQLLPAAPTRGNWQQNKSLKPVGEWMMLTI